MEMAVPWLSPEVARGGKIVVGKLSTMWGFPCAISLGCLGIQSGWLDRVLGLLMGVMGLMVGFCGFGQPRNRSARSTFRAHTHVLSLF